MSASRAVHHLAETRPLQEASPEAAIVRLRELVQLHLAVDGEIRVVDFVDELFPLAVELQDLHCAATDDRALKFRRGDRELCEVDLACARGKLRMLCARLALVCGKRTGRDFSPYEDEAEFEEALPTPDGAPRSKEQRIHYKVWLINSPAHPEFGIEAQIV